MSMSSLLAVMPFLGHKDASEGMKDASRMGGSTRRGRRHSMVEGSRSRDLLGVSGMGVNSSSHRRRDDASQRSHSSRGSMKDASSPRRTKTNNTNKTRRSRRHSTTTSGPEPPLIRTMSLASGTQHYLKK